MKSNSLLFKCQCGNVRFALDGDPVLNCNCHCHSCVACCRYVGDKSDDGGKDRSGLSEEGGAALSFFRADQVGSLLPAASSSSLKELGCIKVGEGGKNLRLYTPCCYTMVGFAVPKCIGLNRNAIYYYNETTTTPKDGVAEFHHKPYQPPLPILNGRKRDAFDPSAVPDPSHSMYPLGFLFSLVKTGFNPFAAGFQNEQSTMFFPPISNAEVVDITW